MFDDSKRRKAVRASWITARRSFYQRKYDLSEQNYRNVIDNTEDNFIEFNYSMRDLGMVLQKQNLPFSI